MRVALFGIAMFLVASANATPGAKVFTVNTNDVGGYIEWARGAASVIGPVINAREIGICVPSAGGERQGDLYLYRTADSMANLLNVDSENPVITTEVAKLQVNYTIQQKDIWSIVKDAPSHLAVGQKWSAANWMVRTKDLVGYLKAGETIERAYNKNGFENVRLLAWQALAGANTGVTLVAFSAPDRATLGAALDAQNAPWAASLLKNVRKKRELVRGFILDCELLYSGTAE